MVFSGIRKFLHGKRRGRPTNLTTYAKKAQPYGVALAAAAVQKAIDVYKKTPGLKAHFKKAGIKSSVPNKVPRKLGNFKKYTADPTNAISTSAGGGMTTHSMTVKMGSRKNLVSKLVRDSKQSSYFQFGAIQPFNNLAVSPINGGGFNGGGAYALLNFNSLNAAAIGAFTQYMPLHVYDITSVTNFSGSALVQSTPGHQLNFQGTCAAAGIYPVTTIGFTDMSGRQADGSTLSTSWQLQKSPEDAPIGNNYPGAAAIHEWCSIKIFAYGSKNQSTRFKVMVAQLKEGYLDPIETPDTTSVYNELRSKINFYQGLVSASSKHPMATNSTDYRNNLKIIKEYNFIVDPATTIEERPAVGHSKLINMFIPMYRKSNYNAISTGLDINLKDQDNFTNCHA